MYLTAGKGYRSPGSASTAPPEHRPEHYHNSGLSAVSGTSVSTSLVAGAAALVLQAHPNWTVDKVRRALIHTADRFVAQADFDPLYVRGYGIIDVMAAIEFVHGDVNGDGVADGEDVSAFVDAMAGAISTRTCSAGPMQTRTARST